MLDAARAKLRSLLGRREAEPVRRSEVRQAYELLRFALVALPLATGADKIAELDLLAWWGGWLAPRLAALSPLASRDILRIAGMAEASIAALVMLRPRVGANVLAAWLALMIVDVVALGGHALVVALDAALAIAALALSRLAAHYESTRAADVLPGPPP
jgi:hypothetical protein